ncbi:MAG: hypothetical protein HKN82_16935 [Akkermansiaceae bacterium]|nr:hypothetical protein [Akkermansiaceae bacterium]NNM29579.1 hypothetical protein [Akkermansiaceae bacterium]
MKQPSRSNSDPPRMGGRRRRDLQRQETRIKQLYRRLQLPRPPPAPGETWDPDAEERLLRHFVEVEEYLASPLPGEKGARDGGT